MFRAVHDWEVAVDIDNYLDSHPTKVRNSMKHQLQNFRTHCNTRTTFITTGEVLERHPEWLSPFLNSCSVVLGGPQHQISCCRLGTKLDWWDVILLQPSVKYQVVPLLFFPKIAGLLGNLWSNLTSCLLMYNSQLSSTKPLLLIFVFCIPFLSL